MTVFENHELPMVLTVEQMASCLGVSRNLGYKIAKTDGLAIRVGDKRLVVPRERFLSYLNKQDESLSDE